MKPKNWMWFRIFTFLELAIAALFFCWIVYMRFLKHGFQAYGPDRIIVFVVLTSTFLQIVFSVLNIRLLHHHLIYETIPDKGFRTLHTVMIALKYLISAGLAVLLVYGFAESFFSNGHFKSPNKYDWIALLIVSLYGFISAYTTIAAVNLKKYIRKKAELSQDEWLEQLGNSAIVTSVDN